MDLDRQHVFPACHSAVEFLDKAGRSDEAKPFKQRAKQFAEEYHLAEQERAELTEDDEFLEHDADEAELAPLFDGLRKFGQINEAYLCRKKLCYLPEVPLYVLFVERRQKSGIFGDGDDDLLDTLLRDLQFPGETFVLLSDSDNKAYAEAIKQIPNALIYER